MAGIRHYDENIKAAVLADLRRTIGTAEGAHRRVADRNGVSANTVKRWADAVGLTSEAARTATKNAAEAQRATNAQRREALAARMLDEAESALDDMRAQALVFNFGGKDNTYNEHVLSRPPTGDRRNLMIIAATAVDKHKVLEQFDSAGTAGQQADLLVKLLTGRDGA